MAAEADVIVQNFRPGVVDRIGIGYDAIKEIAPSIIYVSISGFGDVGPYAQKPVYDPLVQALSGLTTVQGGSDELRPRLVRTIVPDKLTGYAAAQSISAALFHRERTGGRAKGEGQHIKLSMLDTVVSFLWGSDMGAHTFVGDELEKETAQSFIDLIYETAEDYISVAVQSDKEWAGLMCHALLFSHDVKSSLTPKFWPMKQLLKPVIQLLECCGRHDLHRNFQTRQQSFDCLRLRLVQTAISCWGIWVLVMKKLRHWQKRV